MKSRKVLLKCEFKLTLKHFLRFPKRRKLLSRFRGNKVGIKRPISMQNGNTVAGFTTKNASSPEC
jgi:hypothetical protein